MSILIIYMTSRDALFPEAFIRKTTVFSFNYFCPAVTELALDLHVNFCTCLCISSHFSRLSTLYSRLLIGLYTQL